MGKLPTELVKMWLKLLMEHCYAIVVGCAAADEGERESVVEQQAYIFFYCSYISSADRLLVAASPEGSALDPCMTRICTNPQLEKGRIIVFEKSRPSLLSLLSLLFRRTSGLRPRSQKHRIFGPVMRLALWCLRASLTQCSDRRGHQGPALRS